MSSNTRTCYQLIAKGNSINGWMFRMRSKQIFTDRAAAERYIHEFRQKCIDPTHFEYATDDDDLKIDIQELELLD